MDYRYNSRGWLKSINNAALNNADPLINNDTNDAFGEEISYDDYGTTALKQYNGNISAVSWQGKKQPSGGAAQIAQSYEYSYDKLNRLTLANYTTAGLTGRYNESLTYDVAGNIKKLNRYRDISNAATPIDQLTYVYDNSDNSSRLLSVTDVSGSNEGQLNGTTGYTYDPNGNLWVDNKKGLTFTYNYLNLPYTVTPTTGNALTYIYDATGRKLRKVISGGSHDYVSGIEYDAAGNLLFLTTEEGRARPNGASYFYEYALKDNLGNTRVLIGQDGQVAQQTDYYAFGMEMNRGGMVAPNPDNKYKYNGKELQDETGLYDYGARQYDPVVGRWASIDPLAESSRKWSPYNYGNNNPLAFVDPDGMSTESWMQEHGVTNDDLITLYQAPAEQENDAPAEQENDGADCCKTAATAGTATGTSAKPPLSKSFVNEAGELIVEDGAKIPGALEVIAYFVIKLFASNNDAKNPETVYNEYGGPKGNTDTAPGFDGEMARQGHFKGNVDIPNNSEERKEYYIHYSNRKGIVGIAMSQVIFPNKKNKVYLTKAFLTEKEVENILFIGDPTKKGFGKYMTIFKVDPDQASNITKNPTHVYEYDYNAGSLRIRTGNMVYIGINPKTK
ncbi:RHS repeat domain-containing protein [Mucilaginibacter flavus]|uniref:RHS repeat domain-containing protein n=1 Tax=Mucilaginibacter flavus TaxID=931504 RepID=UPI003F4950BB